MALGPIRTVPDPVLRMRCVPVTEFGPDLARTAEEMLQVMYDAPGRGLAAPQVGLGMRLFVMDTSWKEGTPAPMAFANPEIAIASGARQVYSEGCLSIPGLLRRVERAASLSLRWQDMAGDWHEGVFSGFDATCIQHERDHLDGILMTDHPEAPE